MAAELFKKSERLICKFLESPVILAIFDLRLSVHALYP